MRHSSYSEKWPSKNDLALALEGEDVCPDADEESAVVEDHHDKAGELGGGIRTGHP